MSALDLTPPSFFSRDLNDPALSTQSAYEASETQNHILGQKLSLGDGRVFRYAKNGGVALVQAFMTQAAVEESKAVAIVQTGHAQVVGDTDISVLVTTASAAGENDFSGGWMVCNKVSPAVLGDIYHILASKLQSTDTILNLRLASPIRTAIGATGEVSLTYSKWFETVVVPTTTITADAAGVSLCAVPINYYFWAQTKGPAPLMVDTGDTIVIGSMVGIPGASAVAGTCGVTTATGFAFPVYGTVMSIAAAAEPALVNLTLE